MLNIHRKAIAITIFLVLVTVSIVVTGVSSSWFPNPTIQPTFLQQQDPTNWCGPSVAQSAIQWSAQYNNGNPPAIMPTLISQTTIWNFMKGIQCQNIGGTDLGLPGTIGDYNPDIRRMNIAYDSGSDPHALAWSVWYWRGYPSNWINHYHYWIYNNAYDATDHLLSSINTYHEPVMVAALHGYHWVLVTNYDADSQYPIQGIHYIQIYNPSSGGHSNIPYSDWINYWFTTYNDPGDPDPSVGPYQPPPNHWVGNYVSVERDPYPENPDYAMTLNGKIYRPVIYLPSTMR
jgi:hypothetical protein